MLIYPFKSMDIRRQKRGTGKVSSENRFYLAKSLDFGDPQNVKELEHSIVFCVIFLKTLYFSSTTACQLQRGVIIMSRDKIVSS